MASLPEQPKTDIESFTAAYMAACKDRPADWNEIGYWYARQLWDAAVKQEREACAKICEEQAEAHDTFRNTQAAVGCDGCWEAILARSAGSPPAMQAQKE